MFNSQQLQQLNNVYTKYNLESYVLPVVKKFYIKHLVDIEHQLPDSPVLKSALKKIGEKKQVNKAELVEFCFSIYLGKEIFNLFVKTLPMHLQQLFEILLWREYIDAEEAQTMVNATLLEQHKSGHLVSFHLKKEAYIFGVKEVGYWSSNLQRDFFLFLPPVIKDILTDYYPKPPHYYFIAVDNIENSQHIFSAEKLLFTEMPALISYYLQNNLRYTNSGKPNEASINKMVKTITIAEFYKTGELSNIRAQFIAGMLYKMEVNNINNNTAELIKSIFTTHYSTIYLPQLLLLHLKGWAHAAQHIANNDAFTSLLKILKELPAGKWVSAENFHDYITFRRLNVQAIPPFVINNYLHFIKGTNDKISASSNSNKLVYKPYISGALFLFAAFGLLEISYNEIDTTTLNKTYYSPYDGLQYLRLTPLGEYITGLSSQYTADIEAPANKLHFDEDSMIILAQGDLGLTDVMLGGYAQKEGPGRYRVTSSIFLKDCTTKKSIEDKVKLFKKTTAANLPPYWTDVFNTWIENAKKIKEKILINVFTIPQAAKELQGILAKDAVIKQLIYKAEGFHILVEPENVGPLKKRLREFGYIIE